MKGYIAAALLFMVACSPPAKLESTASQPLFQNVYMTQELGMLHEGIDFVAFGSDSSWSLKIDLEKDIVFNSNSISTISMPVSRPGKTPDGEMLHFTSATADQEMAVEIQTATCKDDVTQRESPYSVTVTLKKTSEKAYSEFKGCGHYLVDYGLHDIWVLRELNGRPITENDYTREVPRMELNTTDGKILGYSGCNNFFGSFLTRGDKITFADLGSTKMFCEKSVETEFFKTLAEVQRFEIKNLHLLLYKGDALIASFLKVD